MKPAGSLVRESLPTRVQIRSAMLELLSKLGPTRVVDLDVALADFFDLTPEQRTLPHSFDNGGRSEWSYRCAWVRSTAKRDGLVALVSPRVWALTPAAK